MIPVSLYGVNNDELNRFYSELPKLVEDAYEDRNYQETLFSIVGEDNIQHLTKADKWAKQKPFVWPEEVIMEVDMTLQTVKYPDVGLLEHLLTLDNIDCIRISTWMHFITNVYPIYTEKACNGLKRLGLNSPFDPKDIASYGLYVERIEGLKIHAPADGMPEIGLPRARMLQIGLERFQ